MAAVDVGPAELITLIFPSEQPHPAVAKMLAELVAGRDISVLDLAFVTRAADGPVRIADLREILGEVEISSQALISEDDLSVISDSLEPGMSATMIAYEHSWARRLASAVREAGGTVMFNRPAEREHALAAYQEQQAIAESEAAVRQAEAEAAAAERAAERYATLGSAPAAGDDQASQLAYLTRLHESGALSAAEFEAAKARLLAT
jgi:hypothetical protein